MSSSISNKVIDIMKYISSQNYNVYLVGGAVRDLISNKEIHDYDLATDIPFEELAKKYNVKPFKENNNRNIVLLKDGDIEIELTALKGKDIYEDLSKRDFTINAIAIDSNINVIDPYNGFKDIKNKNIRVIDEDGSGFIKDPLRILRAIRFSATKDFNIEERTKELMKNNSSYLNDVAPERILHELNQILLTDKPSKYIEENKEIFFEIIEGLKDTYIFNQHNDYHIYDVFKHTLKVLDSTPNDLNLRYAALFHDIGKPKTFFQDDKGVGHFYGHNEKSVELFKKFAEKYKIPKYNKGLITKLIYYHDNELSTKNNKIINFFQNYGTDQYEIQLLFLLKQADVLGQNPKYNDRLEKNKSIETKYITLLNEQPVLTIKDLEINGLDLIELGFDGPKIGIILKNILEKVLNGELNNNKNDILNFIDNEFNSNKTNKIK